ncbi:interleukin-12 receptor subunit beta-1-like [Lampris incognitus]|uniref:interleukin-12 receptor subunit beta-1-like n=1 Tax=Lampris incognitus TaxID=2546036 RepID=UPI0024B50AE4|nr:interleukin-12 receptor subunit beta-1-like [Lampris incognitus]
MFTHLDAPRHLMDHTNDHGALQLFIFLLNVLAVSNTGSTCEGPTSPQCYRRKLDKDVYTCEWSGPVSADRITYDLYFNTTYAPYSSREFKGISQIWHYTSSEALMVDRPVYVWVVANMGNTSCSSHNMSVVLNQRVKYEAPQKLSMMWSSNNLTLSWSAAETTPAAVEIQIQREAGTTESWENRATKTNVRNSMYWVKVMNLQRFSAYWVRVRQKSTVASNPLWSDWSSIHSVPAEIVNPPEVNFSIEDFDNGTRFLKLTWKLRKGVLKN